MRMPSARRLMGLLKLTREQAFLIRSLGHAVDRPDDLRAIIDKWCPDTVRHVGRMLSDPYDSAMWRRAVALHAIDRVLDTYGVEPLGPVKMDGPPYEYCNTGDPYALTLIYSKGSDYCFIGTWGDIAEKHPEW